MAQTPTAVRFPPGMLDDIALAADHDGLRRNAWIVNACRRALSLSDAPAFQPGPETHRGENDDLRADVADEVTPVIEIECRQAASRWQWRVKGEDQSGGVVSFRRDIVADAKAKLAERFGHPVDVLLR